MKMRRIIARLLVPVMIAGMSGSFLAGCGEKKDEDVIVLRVANWEEYVDLGDWDEEEMIELEDGTCILGENSLIEDFEDWFYDTYGRKVQVEYSTFGTCEELYNQITIGDEFDLACPSEYMIMKMMREGMLEPYSDDFFDTSDSNNYYINGVSPFIRERLEELSISGEGVSNYAACYMWGTLGIVYNPEEISVEEASHYSILVDPAYKRRVTIKDSVRDTYFAAIAIANYDEITSEEFLNSDSYLENLTEAINRTDADTVNAVEKVLREAKENVYSFETDSGKADMVTGKVLANLQWSGDAVYTLDQADEDGVELCFANPEECTNLWFDGWIQLKSGINGDSDRKMAAEAFVNYMSMPENAIRNMYYIGYTSSIAGGDSNLIYEYLQWNYGAEEDEEDAVSYCVSYFFTGEEEDITGDYTFLTTKDQTRRQLAAQYPSAEVMDRAVVMACFDDESNERINRMWTNVRCFDVVEWVQSLGGSKK